MRSEIESKIKENKLQIQRLQKVHIELHRASLLLSDESQWFEEKEEINKSGKKELIGRVYWVGKHNRPIAGKIYDLETSMIVRRNGIWTINY